jgi:hypothetical protein
MHNRAPAIAPATRGLTVPQINNARVSRLRSSEWWLFTGANAVELTAPSTYGINIASSSETSVHIYHNPKREYFLKYVTLLNEVVHCWHCVMAMIRGYGVRVEWYWQGKTEGLRKKNPVPQCHFVHHKSQMDWPGMEHGPLSWKLCWQQFWYRHDNPTE